MAFQNSHFSLAYDRPSITMVSQPGIHFDRKSMPGHRTYFETLCRVTSLALEVLRSRMYPVSLQPRLHEIEECQHRMQDILAEATPHLRHREQCHSLAEHIERTELRLHSSYLLSVLSRVSLDQHAHLDYQRRAMIREDCISNLISTIDAFIELHEIHSHCSRSWISLQRTIASAFLLVSNDNGPQTYELIGRLEKALADHVYADGDAIRNNRHDSANHLASSLRALREIREAFRASKSSPSSGQSLSRLILPSPPPIDTNLEVPPNLVIAGADSTLPIEDCSMRDILGRVSDVMMFPIISGKSPVV